MLPTVNLLPKTLLPVDTQSIVEDHKERSASIVEDAAVNNVGSGNVAGVGVGPDGEPGVKKKAKNKYVKANELDNTNLFRRATPTKVLAENLLNKSFKIGVVGYSSGKFDEKMARDLLEQGIMATRQRSGGKPLDIVTGLTNVGVPKIAYAYAHSHGLKTTGIACALASQFPCFPVDTKIIVGKNWGDESQTFLNHIDSLIRIGGGEQSKKEVAEFKLQNPTALVVEYELPRE